MEPQLRTVFKYGLAKLAGLMRSVDTKSGSSATSLKFLFLLQEVR